MPYLVISHHIQPETIYALDGDMVIFNDDLAQAEMILSVHEQLIDAKDFAESCTYSPTTTILHENNLGELTFISHNHFISSDIHD